MPIPGFDAETGYLPIGLHDAPLGEIREKLGFSRRRLELISNLAWAAQELWAAGVDDLRIDGSFVTAKPVPGDIDGFWVWHSGVDFQRIPDILRDWSRIPDPVSGKPKYPMWYRLGIELLVHPVMKGTPTINLPTFFSHSRDDVPRGYVRVIQG